MTGPEKTGCLWTDAISKSLQLPLPEKRAHEKRAHDASPLGFRTPDVWSSPLRHTVCFQFDMVWLLDPETGMVGYGQTIFRT